MQFRKRDENKYKLNVDHTEFMERNCHFLVHHAFFVGKLISLLDPDLRQGDACFHQQTHKHPQKDRQNLGSQVRINYAHFKPGLT